MFRIVLGKHQLPPHHVTHNTHSCYEKTTVWTQSKSLLGSGTRGAILHDSRTSLWGTFSHIHNPTKMEPNHIGTLLSSKRRLHAIERRLERDPELKDVLPRFSCQHLAHGMWHASRQWLKWWWFCLVLLVFRIIDQDTSYSDRFLWFCLDPGDKWSSSIMCKLNLHSDA